MDPQKIYDSILEEYLPSRWSIWIAGLTPTLAFAAIFLPDFLQKIGIPPTKEYILPLRIGLPLLILFLGTFVVLLLVVRHARTTKDLKKTPVHPSFGFVENGDLKWKVNLINGCVCGIEDDPYCVIHDMKLHRFKDGYACFHIREDGCESQLSDRDYNFRRKYVESLAEQKFRKS
jgi:hypothetical protein